MVLTWLNASGKIHTPVYLKGWILLHEVYINNSDFWKMYSATSAFLTSILKYLLLEKNKSTPCMVFSISLNGTFIHGVTLGGKANLGNLLDYPLPHTSCWSSLSWLYLVLTWLFLMTGLETIKQVTNTSQLPCRCFSYKSLWSILHRAHVCFVLSFTKHK